MNSLKISIMSRNESLQRRAKAFRDLHFGESLLILPNIWDPLGASMLEELGYPAVATASASIAYTHGMPDGENIRFSELISLLTKIVLSVNIPVTADIESGYANNKSELQENIRLVIQSGVAGINIEDYDLINRKLFPVEVHCKRIKIVRETADAMGIPLFINARTDVYVKGTEWKTNGEKWEETVKRGKAYLQAGADGFYPITMTDEKEIAALVAEVPGPVNILANPGIPGIKTLKEAGVARLSLGPGFLKAAVRAMKQTALQLKNEEGLSAVTDNEISSDYLKKLVTHSW
jgi:2-methylisocitrate lyase-like PEP mutase family enzyme